MHITSKRVVALLGPSFLIASSIFLFGPYTIYQGNIDEFVVPLTSILSYFVFPALILVSVISVIGLLLPEKLHQRYTSILFILGILIWLQGNIFVWKYGLLDGQSFDSPESSYQTEKINFGSKGASRFLRFGWGGNESDSKEGITYS